MGIYENLAENLRTYSVDKYGSISKACKAIDINRQQFNRYLNGDTIPRKETLEKIATYLDVPVDVLFSASAIGSDSVFTPVNSSQISLAPQCVKLFDQISLMKTASVDDGSYLTYIHGESDLGVVIRSLTIVRQMGKIKMFTRITGYGEKEQSIWALSKGHHRGMILPTRNNYCFVGLDKLSSNIPSLITVHWAPIEKPLLVGKGLLLTRNGPENVKIVMDYSKTEENLRTRLSMCNAIDVNSPELPSHIKHFLK